MEISDLPGWKVEIEELSAGVYQLKARHSSGASIDVKGIDPKKLVWELQEYARKSQLN